MSENDLEAGQNGKCKIKIQENDVTLPSVSKQVEQQPDDDEIEDEFQCAGLVPPPDGGYGWVVVAASFVANAIVDGMIFTAGQGFAPAWERYFGGGSGPTAWTVSLLSAFDLLGGPIVSALANYYGCRAVALAGGLLASLGFLLSLAAPSLPILYLTFGVMGGLGFGMLYLPNIIIVSYYFQKRRALATGIAVCGSGVGMFALAPLLDWLMEEFTWQQTLLIMTGITLNTLVCAALYRPLTPSQQQFEQVEQLAVKYQDVLSAEDAVKPDDDTAVFGKQPTKPMDYLLPEGHESKLTDIKKSQPLSEDATTGEKKVERFISKSSSGRSVGGRYRRNRADSTPFKSALEFRAKQRATLANIHQGGTGRSDAGPLSQEQLYRLASRECVASLNRPLSRMDIFYAGSTAALAQRYKPMASVWEIDESNTKRGSKRMSLALSRISSFGLQQGDDTSEVESEWGGAVAVGWRENISWALSQMLDVSLLKSPTFLIIAFSGFLTMCGFFVPFIFLKRVAVSAGVPDDQAAFLISILGVVNIFSRIFCGWLSDHPKLDALVIHNSAVTIAGAATMLVPWLTSYWMFVLYCVVFGFGVACFASLRSIICVEVLGLERLSSSFGLALLFMGVAALLGAPAAGTLADATGNYDLAFLITGGLIAVSGLIGFPLRAVARCEGNLAPSAADDQLNAEDAAAAHNGGVQTGGAAQKLQPGNSQLQVDREIARVSEAAAKDDKMLDNFYVV